MSFWTRWLRLINLGPILAKRIPAPKTAKRPWARRLRVLQFEERILPSVTLIGSNSYAYNASGTNTTIAISLNEAVAVGNTVIVSLAHALIAAPTHLRQWIQKGMCTPGMRTLIMGAGARLARTSRLLRPDHHGVGLGQHDHHYFAWRQCGRGAAASAYVVSGLLTSSYVDQTKTSSGTSTAPTSTSTSTTVQANELLFGVIGNDGGSTPTVTAGASYTSLTHVTTGATTNDLSLFSESQFVSANGHVRGHREL